MSLLFQNPTTAKRFGFVGSLAVETAASLVAPAGGLLVSLACNATGPK